MQVRLPNSNNRPYHLVDHTTAALPLPHHCLESAKDRSLHLWGPRAERATLGSYTGQTEESARYPDLNNNDNTNKYR